MYELKLCHYFYPFELFCSDIWGLKEYFDQYKQSMTDILAQQYDKELEIYINSTDDGHTTIEMAFRFIK
jgi:hypothetical protein